MITLNRHKHGSLYLKPRLQVSEFEWQSFLKDNNSEELFTDWRIQEALSEWSSYSNKSWALLDNKHRIKAIFAVQIINSKYSPYFRRIKVFQVSAISLVSLVKYIKEALSAQKAIDLIQIKVKTKLPLDVRIGIGAIRGKQELHRIIDLERNYGEIFSSYRKSTRYLIKQGRNRFSSRIGNSSDLEIFYRCHLEHRLNLGLEPIPFSYFEKLFHSQNEDTFLKTVFVEEDEKTVSSALFVIINNRAVYLSGNSNRLSSGSSHYSIDKFIEYGTKNGLHCLDLGKIDSRKSKGKSGGISKFKVGFGGLDEGHYVYSLLD